MRHPPSYAYESAQNAWLGPSSQFSSWRRSPPQSDHPGVACHCQSSTTTCVDLIHIAATPAIWSCSVCTTHGEERTPVLAKLVWDCGGWVASHTHSRPSAPENNVNTRSIYQYIPVHTGMYQYILVCICMYTYELVHSTTSQYILVCTYISIYRYILVHTSI